MGVVDHPEQRLVRCQFGRESQGGEADEVPIGRITPAQAEGCGEGVRLGAGEPSDLAVDPPEELVQGAVRQHHLGFDAAGACHPKP